MVRDDIASALTYMIALSTSNAFVVIGCCSPLDAVTLRSTMAYKLDSTTQQLSYRV